MAVTHTLPMEPPEVRTDRYGFGGPRRQQLSEDTRKEGACPSLESLISHVDDTEAKKIERSASTSQHVQKRPQNQDQCL